MICKQKQKPWGGSRILLTEGPGAPFTYFTDGGGGIFCPRDFLGSEILAKRDLFGSMKDVGIFLGRKKTQGFF